MIFDLTCCPKTYILFYFVGSGLTRLLCIDCFVDVISYSSIRSLLFFTCYCEQKQTTRTKLTLYIVAVPQLLYYYLRHQSSTCRAVESILPRKLSKSFVKLFHSSIRMGMYLYVKTKFNPLIQTMKY